MVGLGNGFSSMELKESSGYCKEKYFQVSLDLSSMNFEGHRQLFQFQNKLLYEIVALTTPAFISPVIATWFASFTTHQTLGLLSSSPKYIW